jgi:hypothetical protein
MLSGQLAIAVAALFAGAAFYVGFVEQPARLKLEDRALLAEWKPAYKRGTGMQASLAAAGFLIGLLAFWQSGNWYWLIGAVIIVANWPYTFVAIMPTNRQLYAIDLASAGSTSRALIERWGALHAVRTALGMAATVVFLWASLH